MKKITIFCLLFSIFYTFSQFIYAQNNDVKSGYKISITLNHYDDNVLYLVNYYAGESAVIDSSFSKKGVFNFTNKKTKLHSGIYSIQTATNQQLFDILIDKSRFFTIETDYETPLQYLSIKKSEENIQFFEYQKALVTDQDLTPFLETSPNSLLSKYVKAQNFPIYQTLFSDTAFLNNNLSIDQINHHIFKSYFDHIDLKDDRLFRSPLSINIKLYFSELMSQMIQDDEEMFSTVDRFLERTIDTNTRPINAEIQYYYVKKLMQLYISNLPEFDTLFLYLYDHYYYPDNDQWGIFDASYKRVFTMVEARKRKTMVGKYIDPIEAFDKDKKKINTKDLKCNYIILWFWDPDCEHCVIETPELHDFYISKHNELSFEVVAVSVTDDHERWVKCSDENHLEWINLSYSMGDPNYDFLDYFDLVATPGIFVIDKDHKIIARQISLDKIKKLLELNKTKVQ